MFLVNTLQEKYRKISDSSNNFLVHIPSGSAITLQLRVINLKTKKQGDHNSHNKNHLQNYFQNKNIYILPASFAMTVFHLIAGIHKQRQLIS